MMQETGEQRAIDNYGKIFMVEFGNHQQFRSNKYQKAQQLNKIMIKIPMIVSKESWHCSECTFQNPQIMLVCEVCSHPKSQKELLGHPPPMFRAGSSDDKIICEKCTFKNKLDSTKCSACDSCLFGEEVPVPPKVSLIKCPFCSMQNDKSNTYCVNCEKHIHKVSQVKPEPIGFVAPPEEFMLKECPICKCVLAQSLFARHVKQCTESLQLLQKFKKEEQIQTTDECPFCQQRVDKKQSQKHIANCSQKSKFFKQDLVFGRMTKVQKQTIEFMHTNSQKQHFSAKPALQNRFKKMGLKVADLQALHHYLENYAPIIVHIHITKHMEFFIKDTHYRSQFQTNKSSGSLSRSSRTQWQSRMFNKKYDRATDFERVKYGTVNFTNDPKGVNSCRGYGNSYMLLKSEVRERCTVTDQDSSSASSLIGTFKFCYHVLNRLSDAQLKAAVQAAKANEVSSAVVGTYKQIQIHGPIEFAKDIQRLYVNKIEVQQKKFMTMVQEFSKRFKVDYEIFS